jgi:hypothetical protein
VLLLLLLVVLLVVLPQQRKQEGAAPHAVRGGHSPGCIATQQASGGMARW